MSAVCNWLELHCIILISWPFFQGTSRVFFNLEGLPKDIFSGVLLRFLESSSKVALQFVSQKIRKMIPSFCSPARESDDACDEVLGQLNRDGQLSLAAWFCDFLTYPVGIKAFVGGIPLRNMLEKLFIMMLTQELIVIYIEKDVNKLREHYKHINVKYENI